MSQLQVTTIDSDVVSANVILAGNTTVNSSGLYLNSTSGVINTSAILVTNSSSGNVVVKGTMNLSSITIGGNVYTSLVSEIVNTQIFTANGTWTKPSWANTGNELVVVHMWGGGGGYSLTTGIGTAGGGGGAFVFGYYKASQLGSTANVVVGVGGTAGSNAISAGDGGNSSFANSLNGLLVAYGGGGAFANTSFVGGGGGGGWLSSGVGSTPGGPLAGNATSLDSTFGGGFGGNTLTSNAGGSSVYGGGGGSRFATNPAGNSVYGGAGGSNYTGGPTAISIYGGAGGNASVAAAIPGGGGGSGLGSGAGARGEVRVYTYRILA